MTHAAPEEDLGDTLSVLQGAGSKLEEQQEPQVPAPPNCHNAVAQQGRSFRICAGNISSSGWHCLGFARHTRGIDCVESPVNYSCRTVCQVPGVADITAAIYVVAAVGLHVSTLIHLGPVCMYDSMCNLGALTLSRFVPHGSCESSSSSFDWALIAAVMIICKCRMQGTKQMARLPFPSRQRLLVQALRPKQAMQSSQRVSRQVG